MFTNISSSVQINEMQTTELMA